MLMCGCFLDYDSMAVWYLLTFRKHFAPASFSETFMNLYQSTGSEDLNLQKVLLLFLIITWPFLGLLTFQSLAVTTCTTSLNIKKVYILPQNIYIFCTCLHKP